MRASVAVALLGAAAVGPSAPSLLAANGADSVGHTVVCVLADERITESSGLARSDGLLWTVNDSGDGPVLYGVEPRTGETVREVVFAADDPVDVEGLAVGPRGSLWVADIGDNRRSRGSVTIHEVRRSGDVRHFELLYPDGPHDAEAILVHPRGGRVFLVTKVPFGSGAVYRAPAALREGAVHRLRRVASAPGLVTDGAFWPDGRHVVLRDYGRVTVHRFPGFALVGTVALPRQEQGEGLTVVGRRLWISSEGSRSEVLSLRPPRRLAARLAGSARPTTPTPTPVGPSPAETPAGEPGPPDATPDGTIGWARPAGLAAAVVVAAGAVAGWAVSARRRRRPRGRRTP